VTDLRTRLRAVPTLYTLYADGVEFWQADRDRRHLRLRYRLDENWTKELLWP